MLWSSVLFRFNRLLPIQVTLVLAAIAVLAAGIAAQPFQPGSGFAPLGVPCLHFLCMLPRSIYMAP